jgi:hypothetical protein
MSAFRQQTLEAAATALKRMEAASGSTQWIILRSDGFRLAAGFDLPSVLRQTNLDWQPAMGAHDLAEAKRLARTLAGTGGSVFYFTDHRPGDEDAAGLSWVAAGEPIENAGFLAAGIEEDKWTALLKNFGRLAREIRWRIAGEANWRSLHLGAGEAVELSGELPRQLDQLTLETDGDRFGMDDRAPLVRPRAKILAIRTVDNERFRPIFEQVLRVAEPVVAPESTSDVTLEVSNPLNPRAVSGTAVIFAEDSGKPGKLLTGLIISENHPLMKNLNWQGLMLRDTFGITPRESDLPLLWQGEKPLILLRMQENHSQLIFNFDIRYSNAARLPAFGLLVYRFLSARRGEKVAYEAANVATRQRISVAGIGTIAAPDLPDFFSAKAADGRVLLDGAAQFSDPRESDFTMASSGRSETDPVEPIRRKHSVGESMEPIWLFLLGALMLWNWYLTGGPARRPLPA